MAFSIENWQEAVTQRLRQWRPQTQQAAVNSLYVTLAAAALWPAAAAYQQGDVLAFVALGQLLAGVGGNLLANVVQKVKDEADAAQQLQQALQDHPAASEEIDALLDKLDVLAQVQAGMNEADRTWFTQTLQAELARLGNLDRFAATLAPGAALAYGKKSRAAAERAVIVDGDVGGSIHTGDTYIGTQIVSPAENTAVANLARARQRYLQRLLRHCNALPLAAMGGEEGVGEEVSLEQVYIALDTRTRIPLEDAEQGKTQPAFRQKQEERAVTALEAATQNRQLVLLGDPGSGKSTFVRQLAARLAAAELGLRPPLPDRKSVV